MCEIKTVQGVPKKYKQVRKSIAWLSSQINQHTIPHWKEKTIT